MAMAMNSLHETIPVSRQAIRFALDAAGRRATEIESELACKRRALADAVRVAGALQQEVDQLVYAFNCAENVRDKIAQAEPDHDAKAG